MKKIFLPLAALSLAISGCTGTIPAPSSVTAVVNEPLGGFTVLDEKAWYYAESLYNIPAVAYLAADDRDLFKTQPDLKSWLKSTLQYMNKVRVQAREAYHDGNVASFNEKVEVLKKYSDMVSPLIPR